MPFRLDRPNLIVAAALVLGLGLVACVPASAFERKAFTPAALQAAQASGKPVLVEVSAPWCPTCKEQKAVLSRLLPNPAYADLIVFDVDFDSQKPALRKLRVTQQSTLIVYRGEREAGRSLGETDAKSIAALLGKAL